MVIIEIILLALKTLKTASVVNSDVAWSVKGGKMLLGTLKL